MKIWKVGWIGMVFAVQFAIGVFQAAQAAEGQAVAAMRMALQRESASRQAYLAYAAQADEERSWRAAALFRALAVAESVHAGNLTLALEPMDVSPTIVSEPVTVGTTAENLRAAIDAEEFERRVADPKFMSYAAEECLYDALASLRYARDAATTHVIRLSLALARLDEAGPEVAGRVAEDGGADDRATYYVCMGCGRVCTGLHSRHCDCGTAATKCAVFEAAAPARAPGLIAARR